MNMHTQNRVLKRFYDILGLAAFVYLVVYIALKIFGTLNSPVAVLTIAVFLAAYFAGRHAGKISYMEKSG